MLTIRGQDETIQLSSSTKLMVFAVLDNEVNRLGERVDIIETRREVNRVIPSFGARGPELRQLVHPDFHLFSRPSSPL